MKVTTTGDLTLIKKINTSIVLEAVLKNAPLSRAQISELTGLNKATVSNLVQDLIDSDLIIEIGPGESSGGRKPVMLLFNGQAGYAVGIDLGVNYIRGVLSDLEGHVVAELQRSLKKHKLEFTLKELVQCIEELIGKAPVSPYGIVGIGVGVPGIVDDQGAILFAPNLEWRHVELQQMLEERFELPVTIDNEANAGAQGEQKYGIGRGIAHQIYVSVGIGIGTGIILNKELYKGATGFSGELGHLSIEFSGKPCRCGNEGCWELYASENALLEQAAPLGFDSLEDLLEAAETGNEEVRALFYKIGEYMGAGISNIVNVFNPDVVIIGNRMSRAKSWLEEAVQSSVTRRTLPYHRERLRILFAELQDQSAVRGAAYYAISKFFTKIKSG
ncbi:ROK family transcriptional regulator [Paenibacillus glycanilyticus]|uniref:ROK family transcriptional regulator n=1 Tax=Paenibacillus glycanilyticus TaxID=126569 RepID=UPI00204213EE|nr:ROK family transcriptional regulator [Paenibacillus glycanilyticus]MCM3630506.1 ROK family transcriptional regulator [Paenibacillus glycanilyticus]